ncbi:MAG: hypothetical protein EOO38_22305 [Cytophagaceae bacterium]|nr:MAG: hypothetical protein EOO38_22305 [Cytophagaceae bacterium]
MNGQLDAHGIDQPYFASVPMQVGNAQLGVFQEWVNQSTLNANFHPTHELPSMSPTDFNPALTWLYPHSPQPESGLMRSFNNECLTTMADMGGRTSANFLDPIATDSQGAKPISNRRNPLTTRAKR